MVRKGGFEPPRYCYRQPLKLVRLPVSPLPLGRGDVAPGLKPRLTPDYFFGCAGGVAGCVEVGCTGPRTPLRTEPGPRWP